MNKRNPTFDHTELVHLWEAITQYVDNHEGGDDDAPPSAVSAREKLDLYFCGDYLTDEEKGRLAPQVQP